MEERDDPQQQQKSPDLQQVAQTLAEAEDMLKSLETAQKDLDISAGGEAVARPIRQAERSLRYSVQLSLSRTRQNTDTDNYGFVRYLRQRELILIACRSQSSLRNSENISQYMANRWRSKRKFGKVPNNYCLKLTIRIALASLSYQEQVSDR